MSGKLFTDKIHIFKEVIQLAEFYESISSKYGYKGNNIAEFLLHQITSDGKKINHAEVELENYLSSLPFNDVKMLRTVMYLGRDQDYNPNHSPQVIYQDYYDYLEGIEWRSKEIVVSSMIEKARLAEYLKSGLEILGVEC